ncbi:hypothetical protein [Roseicella aerolata]|uniref:Uncharacterized protein n=1 Tax=Roseicella aerolata TaxID=2883479 RepID=A0A9X1IAC5_9PROT|nr:hypothetical protein [Roseicella aerolata]MCB4820636.1 hypothetical protein [Roseicella aerolata]
MSRLAQAPCSTVSALRFVPAGAKPHAHTQQTEVDSSRPMPSLGQHIVAFLQRNAGKRFTARDLVLQILAEHPRDFEDKRRALAQSRPDVPFEQQLVAEVGS